MARWTFKTDNKLRGAFGATDFKKKEVVINKKKHRKGAQVKHLTKNKDGSENMLVSMAHELMHKAHPTWSEKKVEAKARKMRKTFTPKQKQRIYSKFNG